MAAVAYGAGLRVSEVVALKVSDIDGQRMTLRVEQGKGRKDRYAMLSPVLLERLRAWWRLGHAQGKILPGGWLFPGMDPTDHVTARQLNRAVHLAAATAGLDKRVTPHVLRHYPESRNMPRHPCRWSRSAGGDGRIVVLVPAQQCRYIPPALPAR
jgi:integrase